MFGFCCAVDCCSSVRSTNGWILAGEGVGALFLPWAYRVPPWRQFFFLLDHPKAMCGNVMAATRHQPQPTQGLAAIPRGGGDGGSWKMGVPRWRRNATHHTVFFWGGAQNHQHANAGKETRNRKITSCTNHLTNTQRTRSIHRGSRRGYWDCSSALGTNQAQTEDRHLRTVSAGGRRGVPGRSYKTWAGRG